MAQNYDEISRPNISDSKLRAIFDTLNDGIAVTDLNGIMTNVNKAVVKMHGFASEKDLIGKSAFDLIAASDHEKARANLLLCLKEGSHCAIEYTFLKADGTTFPAELSASILKDETGEPFGFAAITRDITDRKRIEQKEKQYVDDLLALSQATIALVEQGTGVNTYQLIAEQLRQLVKDDVFIIVSSYNESLNTFLAQAFLAPEEKISIFSRIIGGSPVGSEIPLTEETISILKTGKLQIISGGTSPIARDSIPEPDIKKVEQLFRVTKSYAMGINWQGKLFGYIAILSPSGKELRNPSIIETFIEQAAIALQRQEALMKLAKAKEELEIKVAERTAALTEANSSLRMEVEIRKQIEDELRKSEAVNVNLLENAPNPILVNATDGTITFVNKAFEELTGFKAKQVIGSKPPYPWWPPRKIQLYLKQFVEDSAQETQRFQRLLKKISGEPLWVEFTATYLTDEKNNIISRILIWQDITGRKKAEKQVQEYQRDLRSLVSRLIVVEENERRNIATLIHAGVTQLLSISAMRMAALVKSSDGSKFSNSLNEIYKTLQQTIEDTRTLTFELSPPALYDFGLEAALDELADRFGEQYGIKTVYNDDNQPKSLDESTNVLIFQTVREILHAIRKRAKAHNIEISTRKKGDNIQISIKDDSPSVEFKSLNKDNKKDISFSLFSIRERFRYINGQIRVRSNRGIGNSFTITLPLKEN